MVATIAVIAVVTWRVVDQREAAGPEPPTFVAVTRSVYRDTVPAPGTLRAVDRAEVRAATAGTVAWVAEVGARVETGDVVARLDTGALERALHEATLALDRARRTLEATRADQAEGERTLTLAVTQAERRLDDARAAEANARSALALSERLHAIGTESLSVLTQARDAHQSALAALAEAERDLVDARATLSARRERAVLDLANADDAVEQASFTLDLAREDLADAEVHSRVTGVVERVDAPAGTVLSANGLVASVVDDTRLHLVAQVDETEISRVAPGQAADVTVIALPDVRLQGEVVAVSPTAQVAQNIPVFEVTVALPNPGLRLRPGMTAEAEIVVREVVDTVTVPTRAVIRDERVGELLGDDPEARRAAGSRDPAALREALAASGAGRSGASAVGPSLAAVRARLGDGELELHLVEVVATVGATSVLRTQLPEGAEIEVPALSATGTTANTGIFGLPAGAGRSILPGAGR